jgi:branched-chain amino acid transport system substrate-binding protein
LNSKAITKIQALILVAVIVVASVAGVVYVFWLGETQESQAIKIGVCSDLDSLGGIDTWNGALMAADEINAEGGILGKQIELVGEDSDAGSMPVDTSKVSLAMTKLITFHKVDIIIGGMGDDDNLVMQNLAAEHKIIFISVSASSEHLTERVLSNYEKYKYFFKVAPPNASALATGFRDGIVALREYTGFNKVAILAQDVTVWDEYVQNMERLPELHSFELVYNNNFPPGTVDFTSYFAGAEAAGAEIMVPFIAGPEGITFIKEWYDRQSPMVVWGSNLASSAANYWEITEGKCKHETAPLTAIMAGYPVTNNTLPVRDAYIERWGEVPNYFATGAYDIIRFILPDALERAGTLETEAVIKALEEVDIETTTAPRFIFLDSHDIMYGPGYDEQYFFQWQTNGTKVPVYPRELKEKAGATYTYPPWSGPWD